MRKNTQDCPTTVNLDVLKIVLDATTPSNLARINAQVPCKATVTLTKDQVGAMRKANARWQAHTTGNAYVLYVQARTYDHLMRVQAYGKNAYQAVRRYYKGLDGSNWTWQCTKVVAVYSCANDRVAQAGKLLHGQAQDRAPW
jgi:hypothetical protein